MSTVISVENLGKKYTLRHQQREPYTALRDVITNGVASFGKKLLSPFTHHSSPFTALHEDFWALNDVSFEVKQGDRIGIIGRNGAGKSTLLKILSRITEPTTGRVRIKGRVASLLEVGTGFHPELTGRENIYLNGAILGMHRVEIKKKFDEIVDFAEIEKFLDTPVKRYSSGMYVRLAFAVAAHLEPEILVVDEVLAVGDAQFQKKCLGKMEDVSAKEGRTVLFVSHNMASIEMLCNSAILLESGCISMHGIVSDVITSYLYHGCAKAVCSYSVIKQCIYFTRVMVGCEELIPCAVINLSSDIHIYIDYSVPLRAKGIQIVCHLWNSSNIHVLSTADIDMNPEQLGIRVAGNYQTKIVIPRNTVAPGCYYISVAAGIPNIQLLDEQQGPSFEISDIDSYAATWSAARKDVLMAIPLMWETCCLAPTGK